jgi:peptide methionine sulfoxide reductase MsrA
MIKKPTRGDVRDDGYIFYRYQKSGNGVTYQVWMSPLAHKKQLERNKEWRAENRDKAINATKAWKAKNYLKVKEYRKKWVSENPDKMMQYKQKSKNILNNNTKQRSNTR